MGELDRVADEVDEDLLHPHRVAQDRSRYVRIDLGYEFDTLLACRRGQELYGLFAGVPGVEGMFLQSQVVRLDLGEVEDVVDSVEELFATAADRLDELLLLRGHLGLSQKRARANHTVHGGANLMAHGGEERALLAVCLAQLVVCRAQVLVRGLELCNQFLQLTPVSAEFGCLVLMRRDVLERPEDSDIDPDSSLKGILLVARQIMRPSSSTLDSRNSYSAWPYVITRQSSAL